MDSGRLGAGFSVQLFGYPQGSCPASHFNRSVLPSICSPPAPVTMALKTSGGMSFGSIFALPLANRTGMPEAGTLPSIRGQSALSH